MTGFFKGLITKGSKSKPVEKKPGAPQILGERRLPS